MPDDLMPSSGAGAGQPAPQGNNPPAQNSPPASNPSPTSGDNSAPAPSAPSQGDTRESLLSVVEQAVSPEPRSSRPDGDAIAEGVPPAPAPQSDQPADASDTQRAAKDNVDDVPEEMQPGEMESYLPGAQKRVIKLLHQRNTARAE